MTTELTETPSDEAIVARLVVNDTEHFPVLVRRYRTRVYGVVMRATGRAADADDLFQETWIRVARNARSFDPSRPFAAWVRQIATHVAVDWIRARVTRSALATPATDDSTDHVASLRPSPADAITTDQQRARVAAALVALPERMREAVLLRYFDELSEQEMATKLHIPKGTVKSRLSNALETLRGLLAEEILP